MKPGDRLGEWELLKPVRVITGRTTKTDRAAWLCRCSCGAELVVMEFALKGQGSVSRSCGCLRGEHISIAKIGAA